MSIGSRGDAARLEHLSALADGELDPSSADSACAAWRDDPEARSAWHAWHLIGDVLRSEDLAGAPARDAAFVASLRKRLATEPVVLAPEPPREAALLPPLAGARAAGGRWSWKAPSAVAAGFVLVAGALVVTQTAAPPDEPTPVVAKAAPAVPAKALAPAPVVVVAPALPPVPLPSTALAPGQSTFIARRPGEGTVLRDARLDRYLAAHQQFAGTSALGVPSGFLRNAAADAPNR